MSTGIGRDLRRVVENAAAILETVGDEQASRSPAPGKWSVKEIIGHLVDSASNNHQRFVRGQSQGDLVFVGYEQDEWVGLGQYASAPWNEVLTLWKTYNFHLARVIDAVPEEVRMKRHARHNFESIAFSELPAGEPATLEWFMADYVEHLRHHLRQVEGILGRPVAGGPGSS